MGEDRRMDPLFSTGKSFVVALAPITMCALGRAGTRAPFKYKALLTVRGELGLSKRHSYIRIVRSLHKVMHMQSQADRNARCTYELKHYFLLLSDSSSSGVGKIP